ncbi:MAG: hypothetical protein HQL67_00560 [Magnetococcales bacterium]|nr:hypothetical protein [Magnetococcales bacterium]
MRPEKAICGTKAKRGDIIPETAVVGMHLAQPIDSPGKTEEDLITDKVAATSSVSPDKSRDCTMHAPSTVVSRIMAGQNLVLCSYLKKGASQCQPT